MFLSGWQLSIVNKYSPVYHCLEGAKYLTLQPEIAAFSITVIP